MTDDLIPDIDPAAEDVRKHREKSGKVLIDRMNEVLRPTCKTCPYFYQDECHHNPPLGQVEAKAIAFGLTVTLGWPKVESTNFCGHHPRFQKFIDYELSQQDKAKECCR